MDTILLGNLLSAAGSACDFVSTSRKRADEMLIIQCITQVFFGFSYFVLKGYAAIAQNIVGILRNIFALKKTENKGIETLLTILPIPMGLWMNNMGFMGLLPIVANVEYACMVFKFKGNVKMIKLAYLINTVIYLFFNFAVKNYFMVISNIILIFSIAIFLIRDKKNVEKTEKEDKMNE